MAPPSRPSSDIGGANSESAGHVFPPVKFPPAAVASLAAVLALIVFAPERSNLLWSVNGLHGAGMLAVVALALGAAVLGFWGAGAPMPAAAPALLGALVLVGPFRETGHLLGDTYVRQRALTLEGAPARFATVLSIGGALEVFAGYAESGSVTLVFGALWWLAMLRPIHRPRHVVLAVLARIAFACSHRLALVALIRSSRGR